jgi:DNA-binding CsgD family transcriptional regulator
MSLRQVRGGPAQQRQALLDARQHRARTEHRRARRRQLDRQRETIQARARLGDGVAGLFRQPGLPDPGRPGDGQQASIVAQQQPPSTSDGDARGVLQAVSAQRDYFLGADLLFLEAESRWMSLVTGRADAVARIARDALEENRARAAAEPRRPTGREREVAALIARGLTNDEIAERLVLVRGTVANHVVRIVRKLGFSRRVQIATWGSNGDTRHPMRTRSSRDRRSESQGPDIRQRLPRGAARPP